MQKSIRLIKIWQLLRNGRRMTVPALAKRCSVTERTIYRDIQALGELGLQLAWNHGYEIVDEKTLPHFKMDATEKLVLTLALNNFPMHIDRELQPIANGLLNKLLEQPVGSKTVLLGPTEATQAKSSTFNRLQKAIEQQKFVTLQHYCRLGGEIVKDRLIEPYLLTFREHAWYLVAYDPSHQEFRIHRLDRIRQMRVENEEFRRRPFDAEEYFQGSLGVMVGGRKQIRVQFTGLAAEIVKKDGRFSSEEMEEDCHGNLILTTMINGEIQWLRWILGFGGEAMIISPPGFREKAISMLSEGLARYRKDEGRLTKPH